MFTEFRRDRDILKRFTGHELLIEDVTLHDDGGHFTDFIALPCPRADWPHNDAGFWDWITRVF